jgi:hypothetical protein
MVAGRMVAMKLGEFGIPGTGKFDTVEIPAALHN